MQRSFTVAVTDGQHAFDLQESMRGYHENYANDLEHAAKYYRHYSALMEHWKAVLPIKIHDLFYEDLVSDPRAIGPNLLMQPVVKWDEAALDQRMAKKDIRTASQWQARKPIYQTSVDSWRIYENQLQPIADELADITAQYNEARKSA